MALPDTYIVSYLRLRRVVGILGMALPLGLIIGLAWTSGQVLSSISGYYHSNLRDLFVGTMCAIGLFLIFYRGQDLREDIVTNIAGGAAVLVALFPTRPAIDPTQADKNIGYVHLVFAGIFFLMLAVICLFLFTRPEVDPVPDPGRKKIRNILYIVCGCVILVCLALAVIFGWLLEDQARSWHPVLFFESLAIFAFGTSWLAKGHWLIPNG